MRTTKSNAKRQYLEDIFKDTPDMAQIGQKLAESERHMQLSAPEAAILRFLVELGKVEKIVEIGTLGGYSAICMAKSLPENGVVYTIDKDKSKAALIKDNIRDCKVEGKIKAITGNAMDMLALLEKEAPFDMVFIDADKAMYPAYLDWAEANVKKGGIIAGDNSFLFGAVYGEDTRGMKPAAIEAMRSFNRRLADVKKYTPVLFPTEEGMTVAIKNF